MTNERKPDLYYSFGAVAEDTVIARTQAEVVDQLRAKLAASERAGLNTRVKAIEAEIARIEKEL